MPTAFRLKYGLPPARLTAPVNDETDLHFIPALCDEEPSLTISNTLPIITCWCFFGDTRRFPLPRPTAYIQDSGLVADEPVIKRFASASKPAPAVTRRIYVLRKRPIC